MAFTFLSWCPLSLTAKLNSNISKTVSCSHTFFPRVCVSLLSVCFMIAPTDNNGFGFATLNWKPLSDVLYLNIVRLEPRIIIFVLIINYDPVFSAPSPEPRGGGDVDMVDMSQSPGGAGWTCKHCTYINQHGHENCDMCGLPEH